jgi:hypothetical protein
MKTPKKYRIMGNYLYPPLVSTETFATAEDARKKNKQWTKDANSQGLIWRGRVYANKP